MPNKPEQAPAGRLLSIQELSELLGVPVATIYTWRSRGESSPKASKIGKHLRWRQEDVDEWLEGLAS